MTDDTAIADPTIDEPGPASIAVATCSVVLVGQEVRCGGAARAAMAGRHAPAVGGRRSGDTFHQMNDNSTPRRWRLRAT
jgi:hypothetical protein